MLKKILSLIEYIVVFALLTCFCFYINRNVVIKGLYMDDLFSWSWFPECSFYDFAIKLYGATRYRPFYEALQYFEYIIVGNNPIYFSYANMLFNSVVALFVYHFSKKLNAKQIIAFVVAGLYILVHFSYYQIGQVLGILETEAQFFALIILFSSLVLANVIGKKNVSQDNKDIRNIVLIIFIFVMYFVVAFTHERYLGLLPVVILGIIFSDSKKKTKIISFVILLIEVVSICIIRYIAIGVVMPAGTGGSRVEDTFTFMEAITNSLKQVAFIFGINIGPEHLVGIDFASIADMKMIMPILGWNVSIQKMTYISIAILVVIVIIYIVKKILKIVRDIKVLNDGNVAQKEVNRKKFHLIDYIKGDILFLVFIAMCIGASSVTIRIEMRFVYASFTASLLYLAYMCGYIFDENVVENEVDSKGQKKLSIVRVMFVIVVSGLVVAFAICRYPIEKTYRDNYYKIYCFVDQSRVNSLYDCTVGKYGLEDILKNRTVYIMKNEYNMTDFYADYIYRVYGYNGKDSKIKFINEVADLPEDATKENSVVLLEDFAHYGYIEAPKEHIWGNN